LVAETPACHLLLVEGGIVSTFESLSNQLRDDTKLMSAKTIANIASSANCRQGLVDSGAMDFIVKISRGASVEAKSKCTLAIGYLSEYTHTATSNVSTMLSLVEDVDQYQSPEGTKEKDTKMKRINMIRDASKNVTFLEKVRKARMKQAARKTRLEKRAIAIAAGEEPLSSSSGDDMSDNEDLYMNELDEDAVYTTPEDVLDHIYEDFQYDYTLHSCEFLNGGKARPTVLEAILPAIYDDGSHSQEFIYEGSMKEIEIDMEPLGKMGIKYEVVHNDFTHDSYRAQEVQAKNKRVVNAIRIGAKLNLVVSAPAATNDYKEEVATGVKMSNQLHKAENSYDNSLPNVPNYEALGMDGDAKENKRPSSAGIDNSNRSSRMSPNGPRSPV
jgi:hypothetical protein